MIIYQGGQVFSLANHLSGRVGFVATMPSTSASIFINNTQLSDTGTYQCLVNNLPDRGGRNIGVIGLTVLGNILNMSAFHVSKIKRTQSIKNLQCMTQAKSKEKTKLIFSIEKSELMLSLQEILLYRFDWAL